MHRHSWLLALSLGVLLLLPTGAGALTDAQRTCQMQVAKEGQSFIRKSSKALRRCQDRISAGTLAPATDCTVEPRAAAGVQTATQRLTDRITRRCPDAVVPTLIFGGSCFGAATTSELVACQLAEHQAQELALIDTMYATPPELSAARKRCQMGVAREGAKYATRRHVSSGAARIASSGVRRRPPPTARRRRHSRRPRACRSPPSRTAAATPPWHR
jgi:hypothetical protein